MKSIYKRTKRFARILLVVMGFEILMPLTSLALTGGPSQPEVQGFKPISASDMVNPFTGDFSYNIPLLDIEGYPINMSYSSGITNDQEASWVGLGWSLNPGVATRSMRGIPDEFDGDRIKKEFNIKRNLTVGASLSPDVEVFGISKKKISKNAKLSLSYSLGLKWNSYTGFAIENTIKPSITSSKSSKGDLTASLGITSGPDGLDLSPNVSFMTKVNDKEKIETVPSYSIGSSYNSRVGFKQLTIGASATEKIKQDYGGGLSAGASIGLNSYTPIINMPMMNMSANFSYKMGGEAIGIFAEADISGYVSEQHLNMANNTMYLPAYGYNHIQNAVNSKGEINAMQDVNRDWDVPFNINTPSLPVTNFTYDFLNVSGQGVAGTYRPFRNDIGYVSDNYARNISGSASMGIESGFGNANHLGFNFKGNEVNTTTKTWTKNNAVTDKYNYADDASNPLYEPSTYKQLGELSVDDEPEFYNGIKNEKAVRIEIEKSGLGTAAINKLVDEDRTTSTFNAQPYKKKRIKRNQTLTIVKQEDKNSRTDVGYQDLNYVPNHHTREITITRNDGARYVYGIPAYNRLQEETSFAVGIKEDINVTTEEDKSVHLMHLDQSKGTYEYANSMNSTSNDRGTDNYYSNTTLPPFAHSYLLTCVLSPDYVDADKTAGPSDHDIGNYTRFYYDKLPSLYKWRSPYGESEANYSEGLKSDFRDDKANYIYGEKELWFLSRVETKNHIAIFHTRDRSDGYGVRGKNGGQGDVSTKCLYKISLYSKPDYEALGASATPIKEVHFEYDYSLCPGVDNNSGNPEIIDGVDINQDKGKLTLKKIYFTYGNSNKAKFSPYKFDYTHATYTNNPAYGIKNIDRWGNYQPNSGSADLFDHTAPMSNAEYPYTEQDKSLTDEYVNAWTLQSIQLPSGGKITIVSESDDYAYVQDKRAMEMFTIESIGESVSEIENYNRSALMDKQDVKQYLKIKLKEELPPSTTTAEFGEKYLQGIGENEFYYRFLVDMTGRGHYEYVSGYCDIEDYGLINNGGGNYQYGWIKIRAVKKTSASNDDVHPISKSAWNFAIQSMPKAVFDQSISGNGGVDAVLNAITNATFIKPLIQTLRGPLDVLWKNKCGLDAAIGKSFVRLTSPDMKKLGGGLRVKRIEISDQWSEMLSSATTLTQVTGMEYDYTTTNADGDVISSGVASWEPSIGGDENPLRLPIYYGDKKERLIESKNKAYLDGPIGASYFPSPGVGYSKVTMKNLGNINITRHATGYVVNEYYTARDFPVITTKTDLKPIKRKTPMPLKLLSLFTRDYVAVSQGYSIQINDMHGKQKATYVYQEGNNEPISGQKFIYQADPYKKDSWKLDNVCTIVRPDGTTEDREIGLEYDFVMDFREQQTESVSLGLDPNLSTFLAAFIPAIIPAIWPSASIEDTKFRSAVVTKVIYKYGILKETVVFDLGSKISTDNLAYDSETGLVLLTRTVNEFDDFAYTFNYPAHWYYDGMGQAYKNLGAEFGNLSNSSGVVSGVDDVTKYFVPGDELLVNGSLLAWVESVNSNNTINLINEAGLSFNNSIQSVKIIRSGRRNVIGTGMGMILSKTNPLDKLRRNAFEGIINTDAQVFKDEWNTFCECFENSGSVMKNTKNPYQNGLKGTWRPFKSYSYLTQRKQTWVENNTDIRRDGLFKAFNPFWKWANGEWVIDENNWTWTAEITEVSPYGSELENMDPLYRYSAAVFGYNKSIPTAVGSNMQYREIAFDGFEDYDFPSCTDDHFSFRGMGPLHGDAHTGKSSFLADPNLPTSIVKQLINCGQ